MTRTQQDTQFADWMQEHSSIAVRTARAFEFETDGQADLLQEILVEWWRSIPSFPTSGNPRRWLYRVSMNAAITWQRRECRRRRIIDHAAPFAQLIEGVAEPIGSIDHEAIDDLYRAIRQLRPVERALIVLHLDGFSYEEIAGTFGISINAVGSRLTRVRDHLAKSLKGMHRHERI